MSYEVTYENIKDWGGLKELEWDCGFKYGTDVMITGYNRLIFGEVVLKCKHKDCNVIGIEYADGDFITYNEAEMEDKLGGIYIKPLAIVEGKAVYQGDVLWQVDTSNNIYLRIVARADQDGYLRFIEGGGVCLDGTGSKLSWNKPEETEEVQEPIENPIHDPKKFKVGDKVQVVKSLSNGTCWGDFNSSFNSWYSEKNDLVGVIGIIVDTTKSSIYIDIDDSIVLPSSCLELVVQEQECTTNIKEVTLESLNAKLDKLDKLIRYLVNTNESEMRFQKETKYS